MADVYRCSLVRSDGLPASAQFAVKVLREAWDGENVLRFSEEAHLLRRLRHPYLVPAIQVHLEHYPPYYVMPVMKETLAEHLAGMKPRNELYRAKYALEHFLLPVCSAALYLHSRKIWHRDIKPQNIFLDSAGKPRLGDLSICHWSRPFPFERTWCGMGTRGYTAPETLQTGTASPQSDIYSLGVVFYEIITGRLPAYYWWNRAGNRPSVQHPRSCHPHVDELLVRMTHPDPGLRYTSVADTMRDMRLLTDVYLPSLPLYRRVPPPPRVPEPPPNVYALLAGLKNPSPAQSPYPSGYLAALLGSPPTPPAYQSGYLAALLAQAARK
jgi:serine/threonine protein kinase